ncbi:DUF445 domain-containing protein [Schlegelella aquatica]|uniref:DUF445 domain-containing protein n=1 Tax=Caldimonas aquatica TaxID=376175 RepID=UPI0037501AD6
MPTPPTAPDFDRTAPADPSGLRRMKRLALGLLLAAAGVYGVATALEGRHPAWGYLAAFAEAAMVGAIADWFAVVALFRHPLGLPVPHTAIIPSNKQRIGENLANFIVANFLSTEQVLAKLREADPGLRLAQWLAEPTHAQRLAAHAARAAHYGLHAVDDERVREFLRATVLRRLEAVDVSRLAGELLDVLTADRRHQAVLDEVLRQLGRLLDDEALQARVAEKVAAEVRYLRYVGLDQVAGNLVTAKLVAGVGRLIAEMAEDPQHPIRLRFDDFMAGFVDKLKHDPDFRLKGEDLKRQVLGHPALSEYLQGLWGQLLAWLQDDLGRPDSRLAARLAGALQRLGDKLLADEAMRGWINQQLVEGAPPWIERYREDIRRYIVGRVETWNTDEMTRELERNIGRDLQFVRINGTLVGGTVGLIIHALTQWLG